MEVEIQPHKVETPPTTPLIPEQPYLHPDLTPSKIDQNPRVLSALRMKYAAEVQLIKNRWGDLEAIRNTLGLSQRKICQLLFVDPSAWTRWTRSDGEAPPHIYRALSWFLLLQEKHPESAPYHWLQGVSKPSLPKPEIEKLKSHLTQDVQSTLSLQFSAELKKSIRLHRRILIAEVVLGVFLGGALLIRFLF